MFPSKVRKRCFIVNTVQPNMVAAEKRLSQLSGAVSNNRRDEMP